MKYTHRVKIIWKEKNPIRQVMLMKALQTKLDKMKKHDDFIFSILPTEENLIIDILCFEKFAKEQRNTWMGKKLGIKVKVEKI